MDRMQLRLPSLVALLLLASGASAERAVSGVRIPQPGNGGGFHFAVPFYWPVERETVYIEREVIREVPAEPAAAPEPPPPPREPFVVGKCYASLPSGCMKMIEEGQSFYYCGGSEWYRQLGANSYKAVAQP